MNGWVLEIRDIDIINRWFAIVDATFNRPINSIDLSKLNEPTIFGRNGMSFFSCCFVQCKNFIRHALFFIMRNCIETILRWLDDGYRVIGLS